jgi:hypothetical protein
MTESSFEFCINNHERTYNLTARHQLLRHILILINKYRKYVIVGRPVSSPPGVLASVVGSRGHIKLNKYKKISYINGIVLRVKTTTEAGKYVFDLRSTVTQSRPSID